jgi:hypothetical protein
MKYPRAGVPWTSLLSVLRCALSLTGRLGMFVPWLLSPTWLLVLTVGWFVVSAPPAQAGWFSWLWGDTDRAAQALVRLEAANTALQSAAEAVNESSRLQADQNVEILSTIQALSGERTELAGHLERISELVMRDSQWAEAISLAAPALLAVSVLVVAALALWITHRHQPDDADVLDVLLIEKFAHEDSPSPKGYVQISPAAGMDGAQSRNSPRSQASRSVSRLPHRPFRESGFRP